MMKSIKYSFHIHTFRCGHAAVDCDELYIKKAIEMGNKAIVFSDHTPFPSNPFSGRMKMEQLNEYIESLQNLKQKYCDQIMVYIGLEVEFLPEYISYYEWLREKFDFLMLGQHHTSFGVEDYTFSKSHSTSECYIRLLESIPEALKTGLFDIVAHPDRNFCCDDNWSNVEDNFAKEIIDAADSCDVYLEKNISSIENGKFRENFWKLVSSGSKIIYGLDAHSVDELEGRYKKIIYASNKV